MGGTEILEIGRMKPPGSPILRTVEIKKVPES